MPAPRLEVTVREATAGLLRLENFRASSQSLLPVHQYLIAELIMLRLFSIVESAIEDLACKLAVGASYANGTLPNPLVNVRSIDGAKSAMKNGGRTRPRNNLRWNRSQSIRESTSAVLSPSEPFIRYAQAHSAILNEMRQVRNHVAHRSSDSRRDYQQAVRTAYGANSRVRVEVFLTSRQRLPVAKIDEYLAAAKIMISDLARG